MADDKRILPFTRIPTHAGEPEISTIDRHEMMLEELRAELRGQLFSLNKVNEQQVRTLQVHHTALVELTAVLHDIQSRSWRGRIRRLVAWLEALRLHLLAYAIELGLADPFDVGPLYSDQEQAVAERERANPEAMPKP